MKSFLIIVISTFSLNVAAQQFSDSILVTFKNYRFYKLSNSSNNKLIIFLHGGLDNPFFKLSPDQVTLDYLTEGNQTFLSQAAVNDFDILVPIASDSLNWLNQPQKAFDIIKNYLGSIAKKYNDVYISGFSDGGTGSFKIFYANYEYFDGVAVFNGYPQHSNFNKSVDYSTVTDRKVIFFSTFKDKNIPYEFLLAEYCNQKKENANTYFYLARGDHSFKNYKEKDIHELFDILTNKVRNIETDPIQGYIKNDQLITLYPFRKKIVRRYNFGREIYDANKQQFEEYEN